MLINLFISFLLIFEKHFLGNHEIQKGRVLGISKNPRRIFDCPLFHKGRARSVLITEIFNFNLV
jgi:hypothetical protein